MSSQNDFGFETGAWEETISTLQSASADMKDFADEMKEIVKQSLLQAGMTGDTAEALSETYDAQVLSSVRIFEERVDEFIAQNQANKEQADELNAATMRVAQSVNINNVTGR